MARWSPQRKKKVWFNALFGGYYGIFIVFIYGPMIAMFILSFQGRRGGTSFPMRGASLYWWNKLIEPSTVGDMQGGDNYLCHLKNDKCGSKINCCAVKYFSLFQFGENISHYECNKIVAGII